MKRALAILALLLVLAPARARAQDDDDSGDLSTDTNSGDSQPAPKKHRKRKKSSSAASELDDEAIQEEEPSNHKLAKTYDARIGLGAELALSLDLIDRAGGPGSNGVGSFGVRANWNPGLLFTEPEDEFWRYATMLELSYDYAGYSGGTTLVNTATHFHYVNLHAMFGYPAKQLLLFYVALGPGATFENVTYDVGTTSTPLSGAKFNLAYGAGAHLNIRIGDQMSIVSRVELMRYRRGYMDDTFLTFTGGVAF